MSWALWSSACIGGGQMCEVTIARLRQLVLHLHKVFEIGKPPSRDSQWQGTYKMHLSAKWPVPAGVVDTPRSQGLVNVDVCVHTLGNHSCPHKVSADDNVNCPVFHPKPSQDICSCTRNLLSSIRGRAQHRPHRTKARVL